VGGFLKFVAALATILLLTIDARAATVSFPNLTEKVPGTGDATYLDLVRKVVPDLALNSEDVYEGHEVIDVRHIGGPEMKHGSPEKIGIINVAALPIQSDGKERLFLLLDFGQAYEIAGGYAVLALYGLNGSPALIDAADVSYDVNSWFFDPGFLALGEGRNALLTMSMHSSTSEAYVTTALTLLRGDRFQLIDTVSTMRAEGCGYVRDQTPEFHSGNNDGRTYPDIVATVTETTTLNATGCSGDEQPPKARWRTLTATYRWDEATSKYVPDSGALEKLAEENQDHR
jgi:hypothetical protein